MPSAFESVVRSVVRELDHRRELVPMGSLQSSTSFQPYCLLRRTPPTSWFWKPRYISVDLSIKDILEPNAPEPGVEYGGSFHVCDAVDGQLQGNMKLEAPGHGRLSGGAAVSGSSSTSVTVCRLHVDPNTWEAMHQERRLRQPEHRILRQLRGRRNDVYVVTEVLQMVEEVQVTQTHKQEGLAQFVLPGATCLQGEGQGHLSRKKTVTIPAGSILAFRVAQLVIGSDWDILLIPNEEQRTFLPSPAGQSRACDQPQFIHSLPSMIRSIGERLKFLGDGPLEEPQVVSEGATGGHLQGLRAEVEAGCLQLERMETELRLLLLGALGSLLQDQLALQALEATLEQGLCCGGQVEPLDGPGGTILTCLVLPSRLLVRELAAPVFYLLGALAVLTETQRELLAQALETGTLASHLTLVEHLLETSAPWQEHRAVSLPPSLLGRSWGQESPAWALLEESGLKLQVAPPQVRWEPQAQGPVCALYACLALLSDLRRELC